MENTAHYTISALLMLKQYAKHAEYALVSVSDVVDEVVVVIDDDADDATIDLARRFASKVVHVVWTGFGEGLNRGIDECSGDWILRLDSDEIVSKSSLPLLQGLKSEPPTSIYQCPRYEYLAPYRAICSYHHRLLPRLGTRYKLSIWEQPFNRHADISYRKLPVIFHHLDHMRPDFAAKHDYLLEHYRMMLAGSTALAPGVRRYLQQLATWEIAMNLARIGQWEESASTVEQLLQSPLDDYWRGYFLMLQGYLSLAVGRVNPAIDAFESMLNAGPHGASMAARNGLALALHCIGRRDDATAMIDELIRDYPYLWHLYVDSVYIHDFPSKSKEAQTYVRKVLELNPELSWLEDTAFAREGIRSVSQLPNEYTGIANLAAEVGINA